VKFDEARPAAAKACFRYGASNSTYRVEETVSGRIATMLPWPAAASGFRGAIAEKSLVRPVYEIETELALPVLLGLAAARRGRGRGRRRAAA